MDLNDQEIIDIFQRFVHPHELPIGFYLVRPDGRFLLANKAVRDLLHLPYDDSFLLRTSIEFYVDPQDRERVLSKAVEKEQNGRHLEREPIHLRVDNKDLFIEDFCKPLYNPDTGQVIAFYGCLVDRTEETSSKKREDSLQERIEELTQDIGKVLHANTTTLMLVKQDLDPTIMLLEQELGLSIEEAELLVDQGDPYLEKLCQRLTRTVLRLQENTRPDLQEKALHPLRWDYLKQLVHDLEQFQSEVEYRNSFPSSLRLLAIDVQDVINEIKGGYLSRDLVREVHHAALDLQRAAILVPLLHTQQEVIQMDLSISSLREFVTAGTRSEEQTKRKKISIPLEQAVKQIEEFASSRKVEIIRKYDYAEAEVLCQERELSRAFANILHNAIKYSWSRSSTRSPWVTIEVKCAGRFVMVSFENWGVPIPRDEVEEGLIFQLGFRGRLSKDRYRTGTGIGLTDVRRVVRLHGGGINVRSRPASPSSISEDHPSYYEQPFLTTFELSLPLANG